MDDRATTRQAFDVVRITSESRALPFIVFVPAIFASNRVATYIYHALQPLHSAIPPTQATE